MIGDYDSETYKILSNLLGIRFAKYLKYSGIELRNIYLVKSLNSNIEFYLVEINDIQIRFRKPSDFIAVSYTHLDVYKRQVLQWCLFGTIWQKAIQNTAQDWLP